MKFPMSQLIRRLTAIFSLALTAAHRRTVTPPAKNSAPSIPSAPSNASATSPVSAAASSARVDAPSQPSEVNIDAHDRQSIFNPVLLKVGNVQSTVAHGTTLKGLMVFRIGGVRLKCDVIGDIVQPNDELVLIDQDAIVHGNVKARYVLVLGKVKGAIHADRIVAGKTAQIQGDLVYRLSCGIIPGSQLNGSIKQTNTPLFSDAELTALNIKRPAEDRNTVVDFSQHKKAATTASLPSFYSPRPQRQHAGG